MHHQTNIEPFVDNDNKGTYEYSIIDQDAKKYVFVAFSQLSVDAQKDIASRLRTIGFGILVNAFGDQTATVVYALTKKNRKFFPINDLIFCVTPDALKDTSLIDNQGSIAFNVSNNPLYMTNVLGTKYNFKRDYNTQLQVSVINKFSSLLLISPYSSESVNTVAEIENNEISKQFISLLSIPILSDKTIYLVTLVNNKTNYIIAQQNLTPPTPIAPPETLPPAPPVIESSPPIPIPSTYTSSIYTPAPALIMSSLPIPDTTMYSLPAVSELPIGL